MNTNHTENIEQPREYPSTADFNNAPLNWGIFAVFLVIMILFLIFWNEWFWLFLPFVMTYFVKAVNAM